jgi:hypothetical protein
LKAEAEFSAIAQLVPLPLPNNTSERMADHLAGGKRLFGQFSLASRISKMLVKSGLRGHPARKS